MQTEQLVWTGRGVDPDGPSKLSDAQWVLVFGGSSRLAHEEVHAGLRRRYPTATFIGCTTAGEIAGAQVLDDSVVATAVRFDHTRFCCAQVELTEAAQSRAASRALAQAIEGDAVTHVSVLSEGVKVNGSELDSGLTDGLPPGVAVTGG